METLPFQQTRVGGETVEDVTHDEIIRVGQSSIGTVAPKIDGVVAK